MTSSAPLHIKLLMVQLLQEVRLHRPPLTTMRTPAVVCISEEEEWEGMSEMQQKTIDMVAACVAGHAPTTAKVTREEDSKSFEEH